MNKKLASDNFKYCEETFKLKENLEQNFLLLGQRLSEIWRNELHKPNFENFPDFIEELKISRATATKLIQIYETFVVKYHFKPKEIAAAGGWSVVSEVVPFATTKHRASQWLSKVRHNTRSDLRKFIMEARTGIKMSECKHKDTYELSVCNSCGDRVKKYAKEK